MPYRAAMATVVAFHAHPDDEVLLTGGTLAGPVAAGHRVVIVVATDGHMTAVPDAGPVGLGEPAGERGGPWGAPGRALGLRRQRAWAILYPDPPDRRRFVRADTEEAAGRLAALL